MSKKRQNKGSDKKKQNIGRRKFIFSAVGGAVAAGGYLSVVKAGTKTDEKKQESYQEKIETPIIGHYDVVVAGGGPSGLIAALSATRSGANTLLIERYPFLGGNGTAGLMACYSGFRNRRPPEKLQTVKGIPAEYIAEIVRLGGLADETIYEPPVAHSEGENDISSAVGFDVETAKVACFNMVKKEGLKLLLHSWIVAPMMDNGRVTGVIVESKSGRQAISAGIVVDATGDGDIAAQAGAPFVMSPLIVDAKDEHKQRRMMSIMYQLGGLPDNFKGHFDGIRIGNRVVKWGPFIPGNGLNVEELTAAEVSTRLELWDRVQKMKREPGMESIYLNQTATGIGVRETRRFVGEYMMTEKDAIEGSRFKDVIAISSGPVDKYHGKKIYLKHEGFDIPYRSLVPLKAEGVILTGRCISFEQITFQSARAMGPAMAIGHASGCAAALASKQNIPLRKLDVKKLQKLLLSQNAELRM